MAWIDEQSEERVAEPALDDRGERGGGLADMERGVPLRDRREVRRREAPDIVPNSLREFRGIRYCAPGRSATALFAGRPGVPPAG